MNPILPEQSMASILILGNTSLAPASAAALENPSGSFLERANPVPQIGYGDRRLALCSLIGCVDVCHMDCADACATDCPEDCHGRIAPPRARARARKAADREAGCFQVPARLRAVGRLPAVQADRPDGPRRDVPAAVHQAVPVNRHAPGKTS